MWSRILFVFMLLATPTVCLAEIIEFDIDISPGFVWSTPSTIGLSFLYEYPMEFMPGYVRQYEDSLSKINIGQVGPSNVGSIFLFDQSTSSYNKFVSYLTDGTPGIANKFGNVINEALSINTTFPQGGSTYFNPEPTGISTPSGVNDLHGYNINSISFELAKLQFTAQSNITILNLAGQLIIDATYQASPPSTATPEPSTMLLMGVGAAGAAFMRRRKARIAH